ncbi:hypothetical protein [Demetria terragena]|uniref:hypothetical protein n=1 Tax=Demetria terragena TaxID=63959 RepID=UPI00037EA743|nr:hypothetical protein [Demetria terragena]
MKPFAKITLATVLGISTGALIGLGMSNAHPDKPLWVSVFAYAAACGPILAAGVYYLLLNRRVMNEAQEAARHNVEAHWAEQAGLPAWTATIVILIAISLFGQAIGVSWLEHLGTAHVAVVGLGSYAVSYFLIKRRES